MRPHTAAAGLLFKITITIAHNLLGYLAWTLIADVTAPKNNLLSVVSIHAQVTGMKTSVFEVWYSEGGEGGGGGSSALVMSDLWTAEPTRTLAVGYMDGGWKSTT